MCSGPEVWEALQTSASTQLFNSDSDSVPLVTLRKNKICLEKRKRMPTQQFLSFLAKTSNGESRINYRRRNKSDELLECDLCGKKITSKSFLRRHVAAHLQNSGNITKKKLSCEICRRSFASESSLTRHVRTYPHNQNFACGKCDAVFVKKKWLISHREKMHLTTRERVRPTSELQRHTCWHCGLVFANDEDVQVHSAKVHGEFSGDIVTDPKYCCTLCGKVFVSAEGLIYHETHMHLDVRGQSALMAMMSSNSNYKCKTCLNVFTSKAELQVHVKTHKAKNTVEVIGKGLQCIVCPRRFSSSDGLKYHLATHTGERRYACTQCDRKFIKKTHLTEHVSTHTNGKLFPCERCPRSFNTYSAYKKHVKQFPGPHNFFCSKCGKVFMKESKLEKHLCADLYAIALAPEVVAHLSDNMVEEYLCMAEEAEAVERGEEAVAGGFSCYKCFKLFSTEVALQQHQLVHVGKQSYQCRFCPEAFHRSDAFSAHIVNHLGSTPYMCRQCNRKFISPFTLATHLKNYPGEHSFTCPRCHRWFPSAGRRDNHDCILHCVDVFTCACSEEYSDWNEFMHHFGSKPYKCCSCSQEFVTQAPLTKHVKQHTGTRPFACSICHKSFLTRLSYHTHLKVHDQSRNLSCSFCSFTTTQKKKMEIHLLREHSIRSEDSTLCPVCGVFLSGLEALRSHANEEHTGLVSFGDDQQNKNKMVTPELCTLCGKLLNSKYSLKMHVKTIHNEVKKDRNDRKYFCLICNASFMHNTDMKKHMATCQVEAGPRECSTCGLVVQSSALLRKHQRRHDNSKPFSCPGCGKGFKVACSLKYHATICGKASRRKTAPVAVPNAGEEVFAEIIADGSLCN